MIIDFKEQQIGNYTIPAFTLSAGEIVVIKLPNNSDFYYTTKALNDLFSETCQTQFTTISKPVVYVTHFFKYNRVLGMLFPITVGKWFRKNANKSNPIYEEIYNEIEWLTPKTKINYLNGYNRRLLSIYTTLSWTNNIIVDFMGIDQEGCKKTYALLKKVANNGGAIILYDCFADFKDDFTLCIEAKSLV
ncbi:MAG: hypothetical protein DI539_09960 [Flavobacterium psychrophilum]|nr:MAG: hypothetical protein DI539_09960 [Flavobacterium psychrophilum]